MGNQNTRLLQRLARRDGFALLLWITSLLLLASAPDYVRAQSNIQEAQRQSSIGTKRMLDTADELIQRYIAQLPAAPPSGPMVIELQAPLASTANVMMVRTMPGSDFGTAPGTAREFTWVGRNLVLWGRVSGSTGPFEATWDPGDLTGPVTADASNPNYIYIQHAYTSIGPKDATLEVTDLGTGEVVSHTVRIEVTPTADQATRVNAAIEDGLRYLYLRQSASGSWSGRERVSATGLAVTAFELAGHLPNNTRQNDVYADRVRDGLEVIFDDLRTQAITNGDKHPLGNNDGLGIRHTSGVGAYTQGITMLAIALSGAPDSVVTIGSGETDSVKTVLANMVDQLAWSQADVGFTGRGGWRYRVDLPQESRSEKADNSAVQWAAIGLDAAELPPWNIQVSSFVKPELEIWLGFSECPNGGWGYTGRNNCTNHAKTGAGLFAHKYIGTPASDPRVLRGVADLDRLWCNQSEVSGGGGQFNRNWYGMYAVKKALADYLITDVHGRNWQDDFEKHLVKGLSIPHCSPQNDMAQRTDTGDPLNDGSWQRGRRWLTTVHDATATALLILEPSIRCLGPRAIGKASPSFACPSTPVCFDGTESFARVEGAEIQDWLWDFDNNGTVDATGPRVCAPADQFPLSSTGSDTCYSVALTVSDDSGCPSTTRLIDVCVSAENNPPVAVPGGPYTACVGDPIFLNGCRSFDPDAECTGDSVKTYLWDLNGDTVIDYVTPDCEPDTFLVFNEPVEFDIQLRVVDCHADTSDAGLGVVRVWTSVVELGVSADDIAFECFESDSVRISATIHAATQIDTLIPGTRVEMYFDDPTCSIPANRICSTTTPAMSDGETFQLDCTWTIPDLGTHEIYVCIDPNQELKECVETDNIASKPFSALDSCDSDPPVITVENQTCWPPDHKYGTYSVEDCVVSVIDEFSGPISVDDVDIVSVSCDEPENVKGGGDGHTEDDILIAADCRSVQLRCERQGGGNGRVYSILLAVSDPRGNVGTAVCTVSVPHDQGGDPAVDDGHAYTVTSDCNTPVTVSARGSTRGGVALPKTTSVVPKRFELFQNQPNPFNPYTTIRFGLPRASSVSLRVYDLAGHLVRTLLAEGREAGFHEVIWDGQNDNGIQMSSGVYIYKLVAGPKTDSKKMLLLR